jgi:hypothetical protein
VCQEGQATRPGICGLLTATHGWLRVSGGPGLVLIRGTLEARLEMHPLGQRGNKWPRLVDLARDVFVWMATQNAPLMPRPSRVTALQDGVEQQKIPSALKVLVKCTESGSNGDGVSIRNGNHANKGLQRSAGNTLAGSNWVALRAHNCIHGQWLRILALLTIQACIGKCSFHWDGVKRPSPDLDVKCVSRCPCRLSRARRARAAPPWEDGHERNRLTPLLRVLLTPKGRLVEEREDGMDVSHLRYCLFGRVCFPPTARA